MPLPTMAQPPITARSSPSALASTLNHSPAGCRGGGPHGRRLQRPSIVQIHLSGTRTARGGTMAAPLRTAAIQAKTGPRKGLMCGSGPVAKTNLPRQARRSRTRMSFPSAASLHHWINASLLCSVTPRVQDLTSIL